MSEPTQEGPTSQIGDSSTADFKPGQKYPTPSPGNGDRVFYETLLEQRPDSEMAQEWCVTYGVLEWDKAEQLHKAICKRKGKPFTSISPSKKSGSGTGKGPGAITTATSNHAGAKRKHGVVINDNIAGDTGFETSGGWEGRGIKAV